MHQPKTNWTDIYAARWLIGALVLLFAITLFFDLYLQVPNFLEPFHDLAQSMLRGLVNLPDVNSQRIDFVFFNNKTYWPLGPFPAILYIPFIWLGDFVTEGYLIFLLTLGSSYLVYALSRRVGFEFKQSLWSVFAFVFASPVLVLIWAPRAHYLAHMVVIFALLATQLEFFSKKRFWVIGIFYAIIAATRLTALGTVIFFLAQIILCSDHYRQKLKDLFWLSVPIVISLVALGYYNYARFGSWLETGYGMQNLGSDLGAMRSLGMFDLVHLPGNLFYFLLAGPLPINPPGVMYLTFPYLTFSPWGLGLIYTGPYFFSLLWLWYRDKINFWLLIASVVTAIPILLYYGVGIWQLGYRYGTDFLPFLFVIFLRIIYQRYHGFPLRYRLLFITVFLFNAYLFVVKYIFHF